MNIGKKVLAVISICSLLFLNNFTYASTEVKVDNPYKNELLSIKNGYKYQKQIENFVSKLDEKKSITVIKKIEKINNKLEWKSDLKSKNIKIILNYLKIELENKLNKIGETKIIEENISEKDKKVAENEILKIQLNLLNSSKSIINKISSDFNKYTKYEDKWNLKINFDLNYDDLGQIKSNAQLKNYSIKNNLLDSQFTTEFNLNIDSKLENDLEQKLKINSKFDYIEKDWLEYLLVDEFKVLDNKWFESFKEYLDTFTKLAKENNYIEIENNEVNQNLLKNIRKINPKKIIADSQNILSQSFLEAYNKTWDKYYLKPTRYACDKIKELSDKFDPVNGKKCSDSQYNDLLEEVTKYWNLYLTIDKEEKELVYEYKKTTKLDSWIISIKFNDKNINSIYVNIVPNQTKYKNEWLSFNFINKEKITAYFNSDNWDNYLKFDSELNNYNSFKNIKLSINTKGYRDEFRLGFVLDWYKINWNIDYITSRYDWATETNVQSNIFNANISWQKNNWNLNITDKDLRNKTDVLVSKIKYNKWILSWTTEINGKDLSILNIEHKGKIDINYFELNNKILFNKEFTKSLFNQKEKARDSIRIWNLKMIQSAIEQYYSDYSEYPEEIKWNEKLAEYLWNIPKDPLGAVEINWCKFWYYYEVWEDKNWIKNQAYKLSSCLENNDRTNNWNKFEITWWEINKTNKAFYINWYKTWETIKKDNIEYNLEENINIKLDTRNNKNNLYLLINAILNSKEIFNFELINESKRTYKNIKINKPTNTIKLKDALK